MVAAGWPGLRPAVVTIVLLGLMGAMEAQAQGLPSPPPPKPPVPGAEAPAATGDETDRTAEADGSGEPEPQPPRPKPDPEADTRTAADSAAGSESVGADVPSEPQQTDPSETAPGLPTIPPPKPGAEPPIRAPVTADREAAADEGADEGADGTVSDDVSERGAVSEEVDAARGDPDRGPDDPSTPRAAEPAADTPPGSGTDAESENEAVSIEAAADTGVDAGSDAQEAAEPESGTDTEAEDERPVRRRIPEAPLPRPTRNRPEPQVDVPVLARLSSGNVLFDRADANGDLRLSWNEMAADRRRRFAEFDRNDDARVSFEEYSDQPMPLGLRQVPDRLMVLRARRFARYDADGDGLVSEQEYVAAGQSLFELMDEDNDGLLTPDEYDMAWRPAAGVVD